jgi:hypothetical protein
MNYSSVDHIKNVAKELGWNGGKSEEDRKFLSDLKDLATEYSDMPFKKMAHRIDIFKQHTKYEVLFLHIREPHEIKRMVDYCNAKTLLIKNSRIAPIISNHADANVIDYEYNYVVYNNGSLDDLEKQAVEFIEWLKECDEDR